MLHTDPIVAAFERLVARNGSKVVVAAPEFRVSAADLDALSRAAGRRLADGRIRPTAPIGLIGPNGPGFLAGFVACRRAGHPTALLDRGSTPAEIAVAAETLGLRGLLRVQSIRPAGVEDFLFESCPGTTADREAAEMAARTAVIKMTSGSAGRPRGVATSSDALLADDAALRRVMEIEPTDRLIAMVPFSHSYGLSSLVIPNLVHGIPLVVSGDCGPFAPLRAAECCEATVLPTVPAWLAAWLRLAESPPFPRTVRLAITAGAPLSPQTACAFRRRVGRGLHVFYGASECGGITYDRSGEAGERGTVGEVIPGVRVSFEAVDGFDPLLGGRVVVESASIATSHVPCPDGRLGGGRFVSQDLARWRGTELEIVGRLDALINVRGRKIDPVEVERRIAEMPPVEDVAVLAIQASGSGEPLLCAVVACPDGSLRPDAVVDWCRGRLADCKIPRRVVVVRELPRTPRGKIDCAALARLAGTVVDHRPS